MAPVCCSGLQRPWHLLLHTLSLSQARSSFTGKWGLLEVRVRGWIRIGGFGDPMPVGLERIARGGGWANSGGGL
jgi:hypothetical protein